MLNVMYSWCRKWRININIAKSNIIHFRQKEASETNKNFTLGRRR